MYTNKLGYTKLCGTITTVVAKHVNSASEDKYSKRPLNVLLDTETEESFLNKTWIKFGTNSRLVKNTNWVTGVGTMITSRNCIINFKLDEFSTSKIVKWMFYVDKTEISQSPWGMT